MADGMVTDGGTLFARKGEAAPTDARPAMAPHDGAVAAAGAEDGAREPGDSAVLDLRHLIRRKRAIHVVGHSPFAPMPQISPVPVLPTRAGRASTSSGKSELRASRITRRHQLTLRLWPGEFDRLRAVASMAHTTYQEVLASAAVIFLDHVMPQGRPSSEERVAERWQRLKDRAPDR